MKNAPHFEPGDRFICRYGKRECVVYLATPHGYHYTMEGHNYFSPNLMPEGLDDADWNDFFYVPEA